MTEPERPANAAPGSPTPEEISARLEALLKRTHALRTQRRPERADAARSITWPPADGELDKYDVVDVPEDERLKSPAQSAQPSAPAPTAPDRGTAASTADAPADVDRPDWSALRLRAPADERPTKSMWTWPLMALLVIAVLGEAAYIWHLHATRPALTSGLLRVDGPEGAEVRVDGQPIGAAPIEHALEPGEYDVEVVTGGTVRRTDDVNVGLGRTVVLLSPAAPTATAVKAGAGSEVPTAAGAEGERGGAPESTPGGADVSDTVGAVLIESTPSGLPVTMGGRPRGVTPITIGQVRPGRHDVLVGGLARQVDITAGQVTPLRVNR